MVRTAVQGTRGRGGGGKNKQQRTREHNTDAYPYITNRRNKTTHKKHPEQTAKETRNETTIETNKSREVVNEEEGRRK